MSDYLEKPYKITLIPGNPEVPATAGSPAIPAYCVTKRECSNGIDIGHWESQYAGKVERPAGSGKFVDGYIDVWIPGVLNDDDCEFVKTCYGAQSAVAASPGIPATKAQFNYATNKGWNSLSRSINDLNVEEHFSCVIPSGGFEALIITIGTQDQISGSVWQYQITVSVDLSGALVYQEGTKQMENFYNGSPLEGTLRIDRTSDGFFWITFNKNNKSYHKKINKYFAAEIKLRIFAWLHMAPDKVEDSKFSSGTLVKGEV